MPSKNILNFIDLFSGAGGLSCGLELAGHKCILGVDHDKNAIKTFAHNHKHAQSYSGDIKKLTGKLLEEKLQNQDVHMVVGGPPCQGFSTAGRGNPDDSRNTLFQEFCRIVKQTKPLYVVLENVTGLVAKKNEKILNAILKKFSNMGYIMDVKVLAASDFDVPEKRKRTIMIGSRINTKIHFPIPTSAIKNKTVGDALNFLSKVKGTLLNHDIEAAKISNQLDLKRLNKIPEGKGIRYKKDNDTYLPPSLRLNVNWDEIPENRFRQTKFQRLDRSLPSPTIMTHRHSYFHPVEDRYLTQREAASMQSFPATFEFIGPVTSQWRQIGNAVPPLLAKAIGKAIMKMHEEYCRNKDHHKIKIDPKVLQKSIKDIRSEAFVY